MGGNAALLPVLMYHGLHANAAAPGRYDGVYSVHPDAFARQLDWLCESGHRSVAVDAAGGGSAGAGDDADPCVMITFDDGDVSNIGVALPLLRERGMTATFFITSDFIGQPGMLSDSDVRALADAGMSIGAHGRSHALLEDLDADALDCELRDSRVRLSAITGRAVDALALPGGRGGDRERDAAVEMGYRQLFGSVPGPNRVVVPGEWLQRIAVTRGTSLGEMQSMVLWKGLHPRLARARHAALSWPKRVLGNTGYERLRARLL